MTQLEDTYSIFNMRHAMQRGELAECLFCKKYETNSERRMIKHINEQHFSVDSESWAIYAKLTGKHEQPIDDTLDEPTDAEMLYSLNQCRLGKYDGDFVSSLSSAHFKWGRLTEPQHNALVKVAHRYRKQISVAKRIHYQQEAQECLRNVARYARMIKRVKSDNPNDVKDFKEQCSKVILYCGAEYRKFIKLANRTKLVA